MPRSAAAEVADYHTRAKSGLKTEFQALARAAFAEFSACLLFVFFGAGSVSAAVQAVSPAGYVVVEPSNYALSFGFLITILAFAIGDCSGAHINPAVTFSLAVTQNIEPRKAAAYMVAQFTGAFAGGGLLRLALGATAYKSGIGLSVDAGGGLIFEFMGTLLLIFVVFNVAVWSGGAAATDLGGSVISSIAPLPIGLAVMVAHLALGPFTGCGINPARVLGAVVWEDGFFEGAAGQSFWIYFVGPFLASLVAPLSYFVMEGTLSPGSAGAASTPPSKVAPKGPKGAATLAPYTTTTVEAITDM